MAREEIHVWVPLESPTPLQRTHDHESRFIDAPLPSSVSARAPTGPIRKTKVASFFSHDYSAERDDEGNLHIYRTSADVGSPVNLVGGSAGDSLPKGPMTAAKMQAISEEWRRRNAGVPRVRATGR